MDTRRARRAAGFTLVELMVVLAIAAILMAGAYQFFIGQQRAYQTQDEILVLQQDARTAQEMISAAVQQTGAYKPSTGISVSMRGQTILAASDRYITLQYDDPYRTSDTGYITADEVVTFAVSRTAPKVGGGTDTITATVWFDKNGNGTIDNADVHNLSVGLDLSGPPYTLYRIVPTAAGGITAEAIAPNVDNFVLHWFNQEGAPLGVSTVTGDRGSAPYVLSQSERAEVRSLEIGLVLRTRNADANYSESFALEDNTVGTYTSAGNPRSGYSLPADGHRRRALRHRVTPRNLYKNNCGEIQLVATPRSPTCGNSASITATVLDPDGAPVATAVDVKFNVVDASSGATLSGGGTTDTVSTGTTGQATTALSYDLKSRSIAVSAQTDVDCSPTGPSVYTLTNMVSVDFLPGYAERIEITNPSAPSPPAAPTVDTCGGSTWTFDAEGFDACGNSAAEDPSQPFQFEGVAPDSISTVPPTLDTPTKTFTMTVAGGTGTPPDLVSTLRLSTGAGLGVPTEIQVDGTSISPPYAGVDLYTAGLHIWPPSEIQDGGGGGWLDLSFVPPSPPGVWQDCADTTVLTSNPFDLYDCHGNVVTEELASVPGTPYELVPTLSGPGTLVVLDNGAVPPDYRRLQYTVDGCSTSPGSSFNARVGVELRQTSGGAALDTEGPRDIPVEGCATCAVTVVKNPTVCDQLGTVEISGCDMVGKSIDLELTTSGSGFDASFSPPLAAVVKKLSHTFTTPAPLTLDIYIDRAKVGDTVTLTAYYPSGSSPAAWSCSAVLRVDTHCESVGLYNDSLYSNRIETGGAITCLEEIKELYARVKDCQSSTVATPNRVTIYLIVDGAVYDWERITLEMDPTDPDYLVSKTPKPLPVELDDGLDVDNNGHLTYPAGKAVRLYAYYWDAVDGESCTENVTGLTSPASICFYNVLASGADADLPASLQVHWGDVVVEGTAALGAAAPAMNKRSTATLTSTTSDRFLDVYVGMDAGGGGGYYTTTSGDTNAGDFRPFLVSDDLGNYFQHVSNVGIETLAPNLDYDALRSFAKNRTSPQAYWYAVSGGSCPDGPQLANQAGGTACLSDVLTDTAPFVFVDTFGTLGSLPTTTGAGIDAAPLGSLPAWTIGNLFTGDIPNRVIYIAGSVTFTTAGGSSTMTITSPPQQDLHYNDNPAGSSPWTPSEVDLPIDVDTAASTQTISSVGVNVRAGLYLDGQVTFDGSPVIYGALVAERGVRYASGTPEIWYDYDLRGASVTTCSQCGTRPVTGCAMSATPSPVNFTNPTGHQTLTVSGLLGLLSGTVDDPAVANFTASNKRVTAQNAGTTTVNLFDSLQPACSVPVAVNVGCSPGLAAGTTSLTMGPSTSNFTFLTSTPNAVSWSVSSGNAVTLGGPGPSKSVKVSAARVGSATVAGEFLGTTCSDSVGFTVGCGLTAAVSSGTPPGNVLFPGGTVTLQSAYDSGGVDHWEEAAPTTPGLAVSSGGSSASVSLASTGGPANVTPTTINVYDVDGCTAGVSLLACPLAIDAGVGSLWVGGNLTLGATGDSGGGATWSCTPASGGDVTWSPGSGATTTLTGVSGGTVTCRAEDASYPDCYAETTVTVQACSAAISPDTGSIRIGATTPLTLTASGFLGNATWTQTSGDGGAVTITPAAAPGMTATLAGTSVGTVTVTATDDASPCSATATVTVLSTWDELAYDDFESGWGHYSSGGSNCLLYTGSTYAPQGSAAVNIQSSGNSATATLAAPLAAAAYTELKIDFSFRANGMDNSDPDSFYLEYSVNGGSTWTTSAEWVTGSDFNNGIKYNESVTLSGPFTDNVKIRFRCNANRTSDDVYIDEIRIQAR